MKNYSIRGTIIQKNRGGWCPFMKTYSTHRCPGYYNTKNRGGWCPFMKTYSTQGTIIQKICWGWCLLSKSYSTRVLYEPGGVVVVRILPKKHMDVICSNIQYPTPPCYNTVRFLFKNHQLFPPIHVPLQHRSFSL